MFPFLSEARAFLWVMWGYISSSGITQSLRLKEQLLGFLENSLEQMTGQTAGGFRVPGI